MPQSKPYREQARRMIAAWLVAFPTITALLWVLGPSLEGSVLLVRTLVLTILMVPIMTILTPWAATVLLNLECAILRRDSHDQN